MHAPLHFCLKLVYILDVQQLCLPFNLLELTFPIIPALYQVRPGWNFNGALFVGDWGYHHSGGRTLFMSHPDKSPNLIKHCPFRVGQLVPGGLVTAITVRQTNSANWVWLLSIGEITERDSLALDWSYLNNFKKSDGNCLYCHRSHTTSEAPDYRVHDPRIVIEPPIFMTAVCNECLKYYKQWYAEAWDVWLDRDTEQFEPYDEEDDNDDESVAA